MKSTHLLLASLLAAVLAAPAAAAPARPSASRPVLPFLQNDYARAVAQARARKVPLFIEAWAPW